MISKFLLTVSLTSCVLGAIASSVSAQERPKCYLIDNSGELTNLTNICNASQQQTPTAQPTTGEGLNIINNNSNVIGSDSLAGDNVYFLGEDGFLNSGINSSYYIDNEIGNDYTAYIRSYQTSPSVLPRQVIRKQAFQLEDNFGLPSLTSILRQGQSDVPFLLYRYPVR